MTSSVSTVGPGWRFPTPTGLGGGSVALSLAPLRSIVTCFRSGNLPPLTDTPALRGRENTSRIASSIALRSSSELVGKSSPARGNMVGAVPVERVQITQRQEPAHLRRRAPTGGGSTHPFGRRRRLPASPHCQPKT